MQDTSQLSPTKRVLLERYLQRGNVERLAQVLRQCDHTGAVDSRSPLVALHSGGSRRPFFFLHGDYREHPLWCLNVARDLGPDQPFYALEPDGLDGRFVPSLEEHAAAHLRSVRAIQPEGPYMLGGWRGGALLAFEMVRQLGAEGQRAELLVMMEPPIISAFVKLVRGIIGHLGDLLGLRQDKQVDWFLRVLPLSVTANRCLQYPFRLLRDKRLRHRLRGSRSHVAAKARSVLTHGITTLTRATRKSEPNTEHSAVRAARRREDYLDSYTWMAAAYPLRRYPGQTAFIWSSGVFLEEPGVTRQWCPVSESAEVHVIAGTNMTSRTEHVHELAAHLQACMSVHERATSDRVEPARVNASHCHDVGASTQVTRTHSNTVFALGPASTRQYSGLQEGQAG